MTRLGHLLATLVLCAPLLAGADGPRTPQPAIVIEKPGTCIAPAGEMRRNHPDMLRHQRDLTVRAGTRGTRVRLAACIECHASHVNGSVLGSKENFCQGCHQYAAVRLDCFECHQAAPAPAAVASASSLP